jgi:hypothetical protein
VHHYQWLKKTKIISSLLFNATPHNHVEDSVEVGDVQGDTTEAAGRPSPCDAVMNALRIAACVCLNGHDVAKPVV